MFTAPNRTPYGCSRLCVVLALFLCQSHVLFSASTPADWTPTASASNALVLPPTPTVPEARELVLAYIRKMATIEWVCRSTMDYTKVKPYTKTLLYQPGVTYFGLPYVSHHNGIESFGKYLDSNKVYTGPIDFDHCLGVTCASSIKVAYRSVSPTVAFGGTPNILPHARKGTVAVGDYQWQADTSAEATLTADIIRRSTPNAILEAYALLQPADALATRSRSGEKFNGHGRLVSSKPVVVRTASGKINPRKSYLLVIEQCGSFYKSAPRTTTWRIDKKYTFAELLESHYVPLTLEEFQTGKLAAAKVVVSGLGNPLDPGADNRLEGQVVSNFLINEVEATVFGADGSVVAQMKDYPESKRCSLAAQPFDRDLKALLAGTYRFVLKAKLGYGNCLCVDRVFTK